MIPSSL